MSINHAHVYAELFKGYQSDFELIKEFLSATSGPVLEIGAGAGRLLPLYEGREVHLVENDPAMLEVLRARSTKQAGAVVVESSGLDLPFEDGRFVAVVIAFNTLLEMRPISFALSEAIRVLKAGGQIYVLVENSLNTRPISSKPRSLQVDGHTVGVRISRYPYPRFGPRTLATEVEVTDANGSERAQTLQTMITGDELVEMMRRLEIEPVRVVGDYKGGAFESNTSYVCGFVGKKTLTPAPASDVMEFYDGLAPQYASIYEQLDYKVPERIEKLARAVLVPGSYPQILDIGCGDGAIGELLKRIEPTASIYGIDGSLEMIRIARKRGLYLGLAVHDINANIPILEDAIFDGIVCTGLSEFILDAPAFIGQMRRLLNASGQLFMTFELSEETAAKTLDKYTFVKQVYAEKDVLAWMEQGGFKVLAVDHFSAYESKTLKSTVPYILVQAEAKAQ